MPQNTHLLIRPPHGWMDVLLMMMYVCLAPLKAGEDFNTTVVAAAVLLLGGRREGCNLPQVVARRSTVSILHRILLYPCTRT